jgi:pimeloyl-ACP methyl ester carboxylesterase
MLARLLRFTYLVQVLTGALIGTWGAVELAPRWGAASLGLIALGGVGWVVFWHAVIIGMSMLQSRAAGPLQPWLKAVWGEFRAALLIFGLRMPWTTTQPDLVRYTGSSERGQKALPVLLVHGFLCNHGVWDKVARALRQSGHPVLAIDLEPLFTSIDDYAPLIERAVATLRAKTGAPKVVLVGHSMGGLAIRAWLRKHGSRHAAKIITLGTPHQGTQASQWVTTPNGAQMKWRSAWLSELGQSETPAKRQLMQLALTRHDNIVHPQREQVLDGAAVTEFSGIGHLQMCLDDGVIAWLLAQVGTAPR